ncbi:hypothetical protein [Piscinibacter sp.]|uniref:hypothetical protein n=1 Tax=Piscinibacter sp. TaxID=1903157 RepID=UPI002BC6FFD6|nr:hypothetical protein [Albitalea sp.]HUG24241.1 hypothetical protein [Albitalea sp.]
MNGPRRVHIDRLELDLRGISAETAEAAARALGPALAQALASHRAGIAGTERVDAGRIASPAAPDARHLATGIARRVAQSLRGGEQ